MASAGATRSAGDNPTSGNGETLTRGNIVLRFDRNSMCHFEVVYFFEDREPLPDGMHADLL